MQTEAVQLRQVPCGTADAAERNAAGNVLHHVKVFADVLIPHALLGAVDPIPIICSIK